MNVTSLHTRLLFSLFLMLPVSIAHGQEEATALLKKVEATTASLSSLTAEVSGSRHFVPPAPGKIEHSTVSGTLRLLHPNYAQILYQGRIYENGQPGAPTPAVVVSDGKTLWRFTPDRQEYTRRNIDPIGKEISVPTDLAVTMPVEMFFRGTVPHIEVAPLLKQEKWEGKLYRVLEFVEQGDNPLGPPRIRQRYFIGTDNLVHRMVNEQLYGKYIGIWELHNIRINMSLKPASFAYTPPRGAKQYVPPPPPSLLAAGTVAPDFTIQDTQGKPLKLSDFRGKVVVLDFWATSCAPCLEAFPHNNAVAKKFSDSVVILAVHVWDSKENFDHWRSKNAQYDALRFAIDTAPQGKDIASALYKVVGIPTQYVIGKDGKIVQGFLGFGGPTPTLENAIRVAGGE